MKILRFKAKPKRSVSKTLCNVACYFNLAWNKAGLGLTINQGERESCDPLTYQITLSAQESFRLVEFIVAETLSWESDETEFSAAIVELRERIAVLATPPEVVAFLRYAATSNWRTIDLRDLQDKALKLAVQFNSRALPAEYEKAEAQQ